MGETAGPPGAEKIIMFAVMWTGWQAEMAALDLRRQNRVIPRSREGKESDSCPVAS